MGSIYYCPVTDLPMKRVFYIAQRKDRTTLPYVREFIRLCRKTPGRQPESVPVQEQKKGFSGIFLKTLIYIIFHTNETVLRPLLSRTRIFFLKQ